MRIALMGMNFDWGGGVDFLRHVANGLLAKQVERDLSLYLLLPVENKIDNLSSAVNVIKKSFAGSIQKRRLWFAAPQHAYLESMLDRFEPDRGDIQTVYYEKSPAGLLRCLKNLKADVALPVNGTFAPGYPVPWVGYMSDFQHKYFPENFNFCECLKRDIDFAAILKVSNAIIVNSSSVKEDILKFYPLTHSHIFNLPFSPHPMREWLEPHPEDIRRKYELPEEFFLVSNQFWQHKDHLTAFRALNCLRVDFENIKMVCTGIMDDYRKPDYISELESFLVDTGLNESVKILGHIPKRDQIEIMKFSRAVVQPTLFEGGPGGGCVFDAASLGVPVILSDISVNKEVIADNLFLFKTGESEDLSARMREVLQRELPRPNKEVLLKRGQMNLEKLGDRLLEAIASVL